MKFLYFDSAFSKEKIVDFVPSDSIEYPNSIVAVKEGPLYIDGKSFKSALMVDENDVPKVYYIWNNRRQIPIAQTFKESA